MASKITRLGAILFGITAGTGLILGAVQAVTEGPIADQRAAQKNAALSATLPGAKENTGSQASPSRGRRQI